jgi:DNA-binding MarR family transcriptional regulator
MANSVDARRKWLFHKPGRQPDPPSSPGRRVGRFTEGGVGITALARHLEIDAAAVTREVQELEGERLIRRRADARDGRRSYVRLSPKGRKLFEVCRQEVIGKVNILVHKHAVFRKPGLCTGCRRCARTCENSAILILGGPMCEPDQRDS